MSDRRYKDPYAVIEQLEKALGNVSPTDSAFEALMRARMDAEMAGAWDGVSPEPIEGLIYYALFCCRIKIGFTTDLKSRMAQLGGPDEVLATEPGTMDLEGKRHRQFAHALVKGREWFDAGDPAIRAHVRALQIGHYRDRRVDTEAAEKWTGRDRMVLYRWVREGRVTRHKMGRKLAWDLFELPAWSGQGTPPPPPPRRSGAGGPASKES